MTIHQTFVTPMVEHWLEREIGQWVRLLRDHKSICNKDALQNTNDFIYFFNYYYFILFLYYFFLIYLFYLFIYFCLFNF